MGSDRLWLIVALVLVFVVDSAVATDLGVAGSRCTVDGQPTFLLGISYYGALETLASELKPWRNWYVDVANEHNLRSRTVASNFVSYDAQTVYFAFARRADHKPDFYGPERNYFHIHAVKPDGQGLRQLTFGPNDDFDPCPLPDGGLAFMSTRRVGFGRCHSPWEPLPTYTLHRMETDGSHVQTLSYHETNEWHPSVLADGRIVYSRWDYIDRSAANFHGLWASNPDGTNPVSLFGN